MALKRSSSEHEPSTGSPATTLSPNKEEIGEPYLSQLKPHIQTGSRGSKDSVSSPELPWGTLDWARKGENGDAVTAGDYPRNSTKSADTQHRKHWPDEDQKNSRNEKCYVTMPFVRRSLIDFPNDWDDPLPPYAFPMSEPLGNTDLSMTDDWYSTSSETPGTINEIFLHVTQAFVRTAAVSAEIFKEDSPTGCVSFPACKDRNENSREIKEDDGDVKSDERSDKEPDMPAVTIGKTESPNNDAIEYKDGVHPNNTSTITDEKLPTQEAYLRFTEKDETVVLGFESIDLNSDSKLEVDVAVASEASDDTTKTSQAKPSVFQRARCLTRKTLSTIRERSPTPTEVREAFNSVVDMGKSFLQKSKDALLSASCTLPNDLDDDLPHRPEMLEMSILVEGLETYSPEWDHSSTALCNDDGVVFEKDLLVEDSMNREPKYFNELSCQQLSLLETNEKSLDPKSSVNVSTFGDATDQEGKHTYVTQAKDTEDKCQDTGMDHGHLNESSAFGFIGCRVETDTFQQRTKCGNKEQQRLVPDTNSHKSTENLSTADTPTRADRVSLSKESFTDHSKESFTDHSKDSEKSDESLPTICVALDDFHRLLGCLEETVQLCDADSEEAKPAEGSASPGDRQDDAADMNVPKKKEARATSSQIDVVLDENVSESDDGLRKTLSLLASNEAETQDRDLTEVIALISDEVSLKRYPSVADLTDIDNDHDPSSTSGSVNSKGHHPSLKLHERMAVPNESLKNSQRNSKDTAISCNNEEDVCKDVVCGLVVNVVDPGYDTDDDQRSSDLSSFENLSSQSSSRKRANTSSTNTPPNSPEAGAGKDGGTVGTIVSLFETKSILSDSNSMDEEVVPLRQTRQGSGPLTETNEGEKCFEVDAAPCPDRVDNLQSPTTALRDVDAGKDRENLPRRFNKGEKPDERLNPTSDDTESNSGEDLAAWRLKHSDETKRYKIHDLLCCRGERDDREDLLLEALPSPPNTSLRDDSVEGNGKRADYGSENVASTSWKSLDDNMDKLGSTLDMLKLALQREINCSLNTTSTNFDESEENSAALITSQRQNTDKLKHQSDDTAHSARDHQNIEMNLKEKGDIVSEGSEDDQNIEINVKEEIVIPGKDGYQDKERGMKEEVVAGDCAHLMNFDINVKDDSDDGVTHSSDDCQSIEEKMAGEDIGTQGGTNHQSIEINVMEDIGTHGSANHPNIEMNVKEDNLPQNSDGCQDTDKEVEEKGIVTQSYADCQDTVDEDVVNKNDIDHENKLIKKKEENILTQGRADFENIKMKEETVDIVTQFLADHLRNVKQTNVVTRGTVDCHDTKQINIETRGIVPPCVDDEPRGDNDGRTSEIPTTEVLQQTEAEENDHQPNALVSDMKNDLKKDKQKLENCVSVEPSSFEGCTQMVKLSEAKEIKIFSLPSGYDVYCSDTSYEEPACGEFSTAEVSGSSNSMTPRLQRHTLLAGDGQSSFSSEKVLSPILKRSSGHNVHSLSDSLHFPPRRRSKISWNLEEDRRRLASSESDTDEREVDDDDDYDRCNSCILKLLPNADHTLTSLRPEHPCLCRDSAKPGHASNELNQLKEQILIAQSRPHTIIEDSRNLHTTKRDREHSPLGVQPNCHDKRIKLQKCTAATARMTTTKQPIIDASHVIKASSRSGDENNSKKHGSPSGSDSDISKREADNVERSYCIQMSAPVSATRFTSGLLSATNMAATDDVRLTGVHRKPSWRRSSSLGFGSWEPKTKRTETYLQRHQYRQQRSEIPSSIPSSPEITTRSASLLSRPAALDSAFASGAQGLTIKTTILEKIRQKVEANLASINVAEQYLGRAERQLDFCDQLIARSTATLQKSAEIAAKAKDQIDKVDLLLKSGTLVFPKRTSS